MTQYYVLVAGSGKTSRANVEALMDDHYLANGEKGYLVLPITKRPTDSQTWAAQFAAESKKDVIVFAKADAKFDAIQHASLAPSPDPLEAAIATIKGEKAAVFLAWDDEDEECTDALALCKEYGVPVFDLTNGLVPILAVENLKTTKRPAPPIQETLFEDAVIVEDLVEDAEIVDDEEEYDDEIEVTITAAVEMIAQIFATAIVNEIESRKKQ